MTIKCSTRHSLFVFSYLCSPRSLLCSPRSLLCSPRSLLCSTQMFAQTQENTLRHPKSASLFVFYSREHFATIRNLQAYLCSTQENTLRLSEIDKSTCVLLRRTLYNYPISASLFVFSTQENTLQLSNICESTCVLLLIFCFSVGEAGEVVQGVMLLRSKLFYCLWLPIQYNARRR